MKGYVIFHGGDAFTPQNKQLHYDWLRLIRREHRPRVSVIPVAAQDKPVRAAQEATRFLHGVATFPEAVDITDSLSANTATNYEGLDKVDAILLTDGSPVHMVERLRGTHTEAVLHRVLARKAALVGVGASAMALGGVFWFGSTWEPGLGVVPHLAILPRFDITRMRLSPERLLADLPDGVTLIGVDESTALVWHPEGHYSVLGKGTATVVLGPDDEREYRAGQHFTLDAEPPASSPGE